MNYHDDYDSVSASMLKVLLKSPLEYFRRFVARDLPQEETPAMRFGSMFHTAVLEPDLFGDCYVTMPAFELDAGNVTAKGERSDSKATSYYKAKVKEFAAANVGKTFVSQDEINLVTRMSRAAWNHNELRQLLTGEGEAETPIYWEYRIKKRCKPDLVLHNYQVILDLKTCDEANPAAFAAKCAKLGYFIQASWYREALLETRGVDYRFVFAAISKAEPHEVGLYELTTDDMEWSDEKTNWLVDQLIARRESQDWFSPWQRGINTLSLPKWVRNDYYSMEDE